MELFAEVSDADAILSRTGCRQKAFERFVRRFAAQLERSVMDRKDELRARIIRHRERLFGIAV